MKSTHLYSFTLQEALGVCHNAIHNLFYSTLLLKDDPRQVQKNLSDHMQFY